MRLFCANLPRQTTPLEKCCEVRGHSCHARQDAAEFRGHKAADVPSGIFLESHTRLGFVKNRRWQSTTYPHPRDASRKKRVKLLGLSPRHRWMETGKWQHWRVCPTAVGCCTTKLSETRDLLWTRLILAVPWTALRRLCFVLPLG